MKKITSIFILSILFVSFSFSQDYKKDLEMCKKYKECPMKEKEMLEHAEKAYKIAPDEPEVILCYGIALHYNRKDKEANKYLKKAIELLPDNPYAHAYYSFSYGKLKGETALEDAKFKTKALEHLTKHINIALKLKPDFVDCYVALGIGYYYLKMYSQAEELLKKAISIDKKAPWAYLFLGNIYLTIGKEKKADEEFKKAFELADKTKKCGVKDAHIPRAIAIFYEVDGKFDEALKYANIALEWNKTDVWMDERFSVKKIIERIKKGKETGMPLIKDEKEEL